MYQPVKYPVPIFKWKKKIGDWVNVKVLYSLGNTHSWELAYNTREDRFADNRCYRKARELMYFSFLVKVREVIRSR